MILEYRQLELSLPPSAAPYSSTQGTHLANLDVQIPDGNQSSLAPKQPDQKVPASECRHARIAVGLDNAHCPDCQRDFPPRSIEYKVALTSGPAPDIPVSGRVSGRERTGLPDTLPDRHWTELYSPAHRKTQYYRYVWVTSRGRLRHHHIPGGGIGASRAQENLELVKSAIARGDSPPMVLELIKSRGGKKWQQPPDSQAPQKKTLTRTQVAWVLSELSPDDLAWAIAAADLSHDHLIVAIATARDILRERLCSP